VAKNSQGFIKTENSVPEIVIINGRKKIQIKDVSKMETQKDFRKDIQFSGELKADLRKGRFLGIKIYISKPIMP
jgi:hypothetical protein